MPQEGEVRVIPEKKKLQAQRQGDEKARAGGVILLSQSVHKKKKHPIKLKKKRKPGFRLSSWGFWKRMWKLNGWHAT